MHRPIVLVYVLLVALIGPNFAIAQPQSPNFYVYNSDEHLISDQVTAITEDHLGFMWVGTEEGLSRFSHNRNYPYVADRTNPHSLPDNRIRTLQEDPGGVMWVGTSKGACRYRVAYDDFESIPLQGALHVGFNAFAYSDNAMWWAGTDVGLAQYDPKSGQFELVDNHVQTDGRLTQAVRDLVVDSEDELWFLQGHCLINYHEGVSDTICLPVPSIRFSTLAVGAPSELWLGTQGAGLFRFDTRTGQLSPQLDEEGNHQIASPNVVSIQYSRQGVLWVGTTDGVSVRWPGMQTFTNYQHNINDGWGISDYVVTDVFEDHAGGIWLGTEAGGVTYYHDADNIFEYYGPLVNQSLKDYHVRSLSESNDGSVWIGSRVGLTNYERASGTFTHFPIGELSEARVYLPILSIAEGNEEELWLGTEEGLAKFNPKSRSYKMFFPPTEQVAGEHPNQINDIWFDHKGQLWLATENQGLLIFPIEYQQFIPAIASESSNQPYETYHELLADDDREVLWIGGEEGLMMKPFESHDPAEFPLLLAGIAVATPPIIKCLTLDSDGLLWAGTQNRGIWRIDPETGEVKIWDERVGLKVQDIRSLVFDEQGVLWASTNSGLIRVNETGTGPQFSRFDIHDNIQGEQFFARSGLRTQDGLFYFGGVNGLNVFDPAKFRDFSMDIKVLLNEVRVGDKPLVYSKGEEGLEKPIIATDTLLIGAGEEAFTLTLANLDFVRPTDVEFRYQLEGYDNDWLEGDQEKMAVTYANLPRGKYYQFRVKANTPFGQWTDAPVTVIYLEPAFYETWWFRMFIGVLVILAIYSGYQWRTARIRKKNEKLAELVEQSTEALQDEIQERIRTENALTRARDAAEIANRVKSEFLANMSHEIRTPLNGIIGLTGLVLSSPLSNDQSQYLTHVKQSADSLLRMVDDLLDFARLEAGQLKFVRTPFGLQDLLDEVIAGFKFEARSQALRFEGHLDSQLPRQLIGDKARIQQVLFNLLANAFKFTEKGSVLVSIEKSARVAGSGQVGVRFSVADTGIGIAKEKQQEIFDDFIQADNSTTRKYGGTGLGLALCRELVSQMQGEIWVESKLKEGSTFYFWLPMGEEEMPIKSALDKAGHSLTRPLLFQSSHVLVVEDNAVNQLVITRLLKKVGLSVDVAQNGREALEYLSTSNYSLILMDLHMPEMDGYEAARRIRQGEVSAKAIKDIPIIAVTAAARKVDKDRCQRLGMNAFLTKPVHPPSLYEVLKRWIPLDSNE